MSVINTFLFTHCILQVVGWLLIKHGIVMKSKIRKINNTLLLLIVLIIIWTCITLIPMFLIGIYASKLKNYSGWEHLLLITLGFIMVSLGIMIYSALTGVYDFTKTFNEEYQEGDEDNILIKGNQIIYDSGFFDVFLMINLIFIFSLSILYKS